MFKFVDINVWIDAAAGSTNFVGLLDSVDSPNKCQRAIAEASSELVMSKFSLRTLARKTGATEADMAHLENAIIARGGVVLPEAALDGACGQILAALDENLLALRCQEWKRTRVQQFGPENPEDKRIDYEDVMVLAAAFLSHTGGWTWDAPETWVHLITKDKGLLAAQSNALSHLGIAIVRP